MTFPRHAGRFWVWVVTLPVSRDTGEWYGLWSVYEQRPDLEKNAASQPLISGRTNVFSDERTAYRSANREGCHTARLMTR